MQTEMDRVDRIIYNDEYRRLMETVRNKETDRIFCRHGLEHCLDVARIAYIMNIEQGYAIDRRSYMPRHFFTMWDGQILMTPAGSIMS